MTTHGIGPSHREQTLRLSRIEGQVRGIKRMIEEDRYCVDILLQLKSAINALCKVRDNVFRHHLENCVHDTLAGSDSSEKERKIEEILVLIDRFRKP